MDERTREWLELLSKALFWGAGAVLALSVIAAVQVASGDQALPFFEQLEEQSRGALAVASIAGGIAGAGILAGLGGILRVLLSLSSLGGILRSLISRNR